MVMGILEQWLPSTMVMRGALSLRSAGAESKPLLARVLGSSWCTDIREEIGREMPVGGPSGTKRIASRPRNSMACASPPN